MVDNDDVGQQQDSGDASASSVDVAKTSTEGMLPYSKVEEIVKTRTLKAAEKARREALEEAARQYAQQRVPASSSGLDENKLRAIIAEETQKQEEARLLRERQAAVENLENELAVKINAGKGAYPDFDDIVGQADLLSAPEVLHMANAYDNPAGIVYELAKNPAKIDTLLNLGRRSSNLAHIEMRKIAKSLEKIDAAKQTQMPKEPLNQLKHSISGSDDGNDASGLGHDELEWIRQHA